MSNSGNTPMPFDVAEAVDSIDATLHHPRTAVIALGSNLGNRLETLQGAVDAIGETRHEQLCDVDQWTVRRNGTRVR